MQTRLTHNRNGLGLFSRVARFSWALLLKGFLMRFYIRLKVHGDLSVLVDQYPKLILIARHSSHIDGGAIQAAIPWKIWPHLYIGAAQDYFFKKRLSSLFFAHCVGAVPIDRKKNKLAAIHVCLDILKANPKAWLVLFPEGSRLKTESHPAFKAGVSLFAQETGIPLLFLYVQDPQLLWPPDRFFAWPGILHLHVGPVHRPASIEEIQSHYDKWVEQLPMN